jgi:REP element-mobilizing transposase RayT
MNEMPAKTPASYEACSTPQPVRGTRTNTTAARSAARPSRSPSSDPKKRHLYQLIAAKRAWQEPLTPAEAELERTHGFKGWYTRGYLPHYDKPGTLQMITYRLADAMPASRRHEWEALLALDDEREKRTKIEAYLDLGYGECHLREPRVAGLVEENLLHFDGKRYRLAAWVVMPNHVHVLIELWTVPLPQVVKSWKAYTAALANRLLGRSGRFWEEDYWDRYIRDETHFNKARRYIESNPVKAGLVREPAQWSRSSANPQWRWTTGDGMSRYHGAQLIHDVGGARTVTSARGHA